MIIIGSIDYIERTIVIVMYLSKAGSLMRKMLSSFYYPYLTYVLEINHFLWGQTDLSVSGLILGIEMNWIQCCLISKYKLFWDEIIVLWAV